MKRAKCGLGLWMAVVLTTLMSLPSALGETETVGGVTWVFLVEGGNATVTGATPASGTMTIPSKLGGNAVTGIGYQAFQKNTKLTVLSIPDSVKDIGEFAFAECTGLQAVTIGNSVTNIGKAAFGACSALSSLTLGKGVKCIGYSAFEGCTKLTVVKIPGSVTSIGDYAFGWCSGLTNVTIPDSVTSIGKKAFCDCSRLTSVTIGNGVTDIGFKLFYNCSGLTNVTIGNSVTNIGFGAFYNCNGLTSVTIPESVTSIEDWAFEECSGLTSVTIPGSVTSIGSGVFSGCNELNTLYVPASWKGTPMLDGAGVPADCTVVYVVEEQSVTFDANGGTCETPSRIYAVGQTYSSFPAATRERYAFAGWWTEATGGQRVLESDTVQAVDIRTLYAHWTLAEQVVTFNANGGSCGTGQRAFAIGQAYGTLPTPTMPQHVFAGWWTTATDGEQVTDTSTVTGSETRTLFAHWTKVAAAQITECILTAETGTCTVHFAGQAGVTYALQCRQELDRNGDWTTLARTSQEKDRETTLTGSMPEGWNRGFYRVVAEGTP